MGTQFEPRSGAQVGAAAAQAASDNQELVRLLVDNIRDYAIITLDPRGCVLSWNSAAERLKGWKAEEIIGQHFSRFYPAEDLQSGKTEMELRLATQDGRFEDEGWRVRKDGSRFWANVIITALRDSEGRLRGFGKVTRDLTARREPRRKSASSRRKSSRWPPSRWYKCGTASCSCRSSAR